MYTIFDEELDRAARTIRDRHRAYTAGAIADEELTALRLEAFRNVVAYAKTHSPFYQRHLADVEPGAITSLEPQELRRLPFTTKEHLRNEHYAISSLPLHRAWVLYKTSGTTGRSTLCPRNNIDSLNNTTALTVYYDTIFRQFGDEQVIGICGPSELHAFGDTFGEVCRNLGITGVKMWPHSPMVGYDKALEVLRTVPLTGLFATPGMALTLAKKAQAAGLDPKRDFRLQVIMCSGELASPSLLENIGEIWGAKVYNCLYASQETSVMAASGADGELYTAPLLNLYEVIDPESGNPVAPGVDGVLRGELVVTSLYQGSKPLVRYRTGDLVRLREATAGSALPGQTLEVLGRTRDILRIGAEHISGYDLEELLLICPRGYLDYQIVIDAVAGDDHLTLRLHLPDDSTGVYVPEERIAELVRNELAVPLTIEYGPIGNITETGAVVSWKAARVVDLRQAGPDNEVATATAIAAQRL
ncbi:phenylacetate--CoA ligase family protein [Nocardia sp. NPDC088792]|uniref:phenylacetate--CoA ligase family protein n=1 Tax=Nocardia sp. NPDC088792 TaxID=3364332 RepID=UPI003810B335